MVFFKGFKLDAYPTGSLNQGFGESPSLYQTSVCFTGAPCHPSMTCPVGKGCLIGHNGLDIVAPWGTPLHFIKGGRVQEVKHDSGGYGKHVKILCDGDESWIYGHLSEIFVEEGQKYPAGYCFGKMGNTGFVVSGATPYWKINPYAGTHCHVGMRKMKGMYMNEVVDYDNGYFGFIDVKPMIQKILNLDQPVVVEPPKPIEPSIEELKKTRDGLLAEVGRLLFEINKLLKSKLGI